MVLSRIKKLVNTALRPLGHELNRVSAPQYGLDINRDLSSLIVDRHPIVTFDIGANVGQTVQRFRSIWKDPIIHCFEPGENAFPKLCEATSRLPNITINNYALGACNETRTLLQHHANESYMNSFLSPGPECWTSVEQAISVPVTTIDAYCAQKNIGTIDLLKTDTQGFDLEVLHGARESVSKGQIRFLLLEIMFSELYDGQPKCEQMLQALRGMGFSLFALYDWTIRGGRAGNVDGLFVHDQHRDLAVRS
jgi:FkbM family methyltransferase